MENRATLQPPLTFAIRNLMFWKTNFKYNVKMGNDAQLAQKPDEMSVRQEINKQGKKVITNNKEKERLNRLSL